MNKKMMSLAVLITLTLLTGTALAHRYGGGMMGGMMGGSGDDDYGYGYCDRYDVDRKEVKAITDKYTGQFEALQQKMDTKREEMRKARANDATTVGQLNALRDEMFSLRKEFRTLREKVDDELEQKFGKLEDDDYGMHRGRHHRGGMMGGSMMGGRHHHDDDDDDWGRGGCRW